MLRRFVVVLLAFFITAGGALFSVRTEPSTAPVPLVAALSVFASTEADAQRARRRSLMSVLFGRRNVRRRAVKRRGTVRRSARRTGKRATRTRTARRPARSNRRVTAKRRTATPRRQVARTAPAATAGAAAAAGAAITAPAETRTVLVVGDFYGGGVAFGLERGLDDASAIEVDKRTVASSGLVREDVVNWPERLAEIVAKEKPDYIVLQIGSNDRQLMRTANGDFKPREPAWDAEYKRRIDEMAKALKATGVPFLWVGVPPVRFKSMNRDFLVFNEWYAAAAKEAGGRFVDVWDGFSDENGNYTRSGPDVSGRIVVLRGKDGINMTNRGKSKLGWYVTGILEKALAGPKVFTALPTIDLGSPEIAKQVYNPERTGRTLVVKLGEADASNATGLAGAGELEPARPVTVKEVPAGRADDFSWPAGR